MQFLDFTAATLHENLALDEALLLAAEAGECGELLRLWQLPQYAVVLGAGGIVADDVHEESCASAGVPLGRRSSGGGTVLLGPGCLLYSVVLRYDRANELRDILGSFRWVLARVIASLGGHAADVAIEGSSDLTLRGRKFAGHAQQRKRDYLLHHGTLLYDFDLSRVSRFLREPPRRPAYRADRPHDDFVGNLPIAGQELRRALIDAWDARDPLDRPPLEAARELAAAKYADRAWIHRR